MATSIEKCIARPMHLALILLSEKSSFYKLVVMSYSSAHVTRTCSQITGCPNVHFSAFGPSQKKCLEASQPDATATCGHISCCPFPPAHRPQRYCTTLQSGADVRSAATQPLMVKKISGVSVRREGEERALSLPPCPQLSSLPLLAPPCGYVGVEGGGGCHHRPLRLDRL